MVTVRVLRRLRTVLEWSAEFGIAPHEWTAQTRTLDAASAREGDSVQVKDGGGGGGARIESAHATAASKMPKGDSVLAA